MSDYQVVVTSSLNPILENNSFGTGGGGSGSGSGYPAYSMASGSVPTNGTTDAQATLTTLIASIPSIGPGRSQLVLQPGEVVYLASSITIPASIKVVFQGGVFKIASGAVLTFGHQPSAGPEQIFDISLGGTVVAGQAMTMEPVWFGADLTGIANSSPAVAAALAALVGHGGRCYCRAGEYRMADLGQQFGDYGRLTLEGDGPSTHFFNPTARSVVDYRGIFSFYGGGTFGLQQLRVNDLRISGASTSDWTRHMIIDQCENVHLRGVYLETNAVEGILASSGENYARLVTFDDCHAKQTGIDGHLAAFNMNAQAIIYTGCTFDGCSQGIENNGRWMTVSGCQFHNCIDYCILTLSTWSGYLDATNSFAEVHTYANIIEGCMFVNCPTHAIHIPDYKGHTNTDVAHPTPAHLDGNLGGLEIASCIFDRVAMPIWGGADRKGHISVHDCQFLGQIDLGFGPETYAIAPMGGEWDIRHNYFEVGLGIQWSQLVGYNLDMPKSTDRITVLDNTVKNLPCNGPLFGFFVGGAGAIGRTRFIDDDGSIAANQNRHVYRMVDSNTSIDVIAFQDFAWRDTNHLFSIAPQYEPQDIPLAANVIPPNWSYKPGDRLWARYGGTWTIKRCLTGGTLNATALASVTGTASVGTNTITVSSAAAINSYQWISVPTTGVSAKQVLNIVGTVLTVDTPFEANVGAGTAVSFATPTWQTIDASGGGSGAITSVFGRTGVVTATSGDYTPSLVGFTPGADGTSVQWLSGAPVNVDAQAQYVHPSSPGGSATVTRTPLRQTQKFVHNANGVLTVAAASIPSGGYLFLDRFQSGSGGYTSSVVLDSGTITWYFGGSQPSFPTGATDSDRIVLFKDAAGAIWGWQGLSSVAPAGGGAVSTVFGRTGAVVKVTGDYAVGDVTGAAALAGPAFTGTPTAPTAAAATNTTQLATTAYADAAVGVEATARSSADALLAPLASPTFTGTPALPTGTTAVTQTALNNTTKVATTAYADAAVAAEATARTGAGYAPLSSPTFTGTPALPTGTTGVTQTAGDSTTRVATTAFVATSFAPLASPALTGTPVAPTASTATNTTQVATTAYVKAQAYATLASPALSGTPSTPTQTATFRDSTVANGIFVNRAVNPSYVTLTDGATVTWATGGIPKANAVVTLAGNRTLSITGALTGCEGILLVKQDATGTRTLTLPAGSKVQGGGAGAITLTTTANAVDLLYWTYDGTNYWWNSPRLNFT